MKKLLIVALLLTYGAIANAQNYPHFNISEFANWGSYSYCTDGIVIEKETNCDSWFWHVVINGQDYIYAINELDEITLEAPADLNQFYAVTYNGCNVGSSGLNFEIRFTDFQAPEPWTQDYLWKRTGDNIQLNAYGGYNYQWSTGSTENSITVNEPGTYWVRIYNDCGELYDTIQVRDNVEIELATCDLESNLNIVTWPTTPAQAEYVDHVIIKRDGLQVGTANYTDGYFLDNIGSDAASRTYTVIAVAPDNVECPIESHPKETIHMSYLLGMGNTIDVTWNIPTGYDLMGYNICEWHEDDGSLTVIDYVGASVTSYTCSQSQFDQGYIVVQGVEAGKDGETRLLSNRSMDLVGLGENEATTFKVYPNPAKDRFTVEGSGTMTITNALGQTLLTREIDGKTTIELPQGLYFVKLGGATRKIVVE